MADPRIAVLGTGANGASIGADLTRAGLDVTFIEQWPAHVEAMRANGVRIETPNDAVTTRVNAMHLCDVATLRKPFDVVLVVVKAYDTRWACHLIEPLVAEDGLVVGVQNGMTTGVIAEVFGTGRTIGSVIEVSSNMFEPGVVDRQSPVDRSWFAVGGVTAEAHARAPEVAELLGHSGTVEISDDILSSKWMKLVVNAAELVPSAILDLPLAKAVQVPGMREFMTEAGKEAMRTAAVAGHRVRPIFGLENAARRRSRPVRRAAVGCRAGGLHGAGHQDDRAAGLDEGPPQRGATRSMAWSSSTKPGSADERPPTRRRSSWRT